MSSSLHVNDDERDSDLVFELRERIRTLEAAFGVGWRAPRVLRLSPSEQAVLGAIVKRQSADYQAIYDVLYGLRLNPPDRHVVTVAACHCRRKLRPHGIDFSTRWGIGYSISPDNLARLNALYEPGERPTEEKP